MDSWRCSPDRLIFTWGSPTNGAGGPHLVEIWCDGMGCWSFCFFSLQVLTCHYNYRMSIYIARLSEQNGGRRDVPGPDRYRGAFGWAHKRWRPTRMATSTTSQATDLCFTVRRFSLCLASRVSPRPPLSCAVVYGQVWNGHLAIGRRGRTGATSHVTFPAYGVSTLALPRIYIRPPFGQLSRVPPPTDDNTAIVSLTRALMYAGTCTARGCGAPTPTPLCPDLAWWRAARRPPAAQSRGSGA